MRQYYDDVTLTLQWRLVSCDVQLLYFYPSYGWYGVCEIKSFDPVYKENNEVS